MLDSLVLLDVYVYLVLFVGLECMSEGPEEDSPTVVLLNLWKLLPNVNRGK